MPRINKGGALGYKNNNNDGTPQHRPYHNALNWVPPVLVTLFVYRKRPIHKTNKQNLLYLISFQYPSPKTP